MQIFVLIINKLLLVLLFNIYLCFYSYSSNCHHQQDYTNGMCPYCNCDQQSNSVAMVTESDVTELALTLKTMLHTQSTVLPDMVQLMYT